MTRERLLEAISQNTAQLGITSWKSRSSGYACDNATGHQPKEDTLIEKTEAQMGAPSVCMHCGREILWEPRK